MVQRALLELAHKNNGIRGYEIAEIFRNSKFRKNTCYLFNVGFSIAEYAVICHVLFVNHCEVRPNSCRSVKITVSCQIYR